ncbi:hypothetical protein J6590_043091 [Homalodisca vitripennis]|nr:hypothetical protein J6590_043091 [Homalodisca vitripennis]
MTKPRSLLCCLSGARLLYTALCDAVRHPPLVLEAARRPFIIPDLLEALAI